MPQASSFLDRYPETRLFVQSTYPYVPPRIYAFVTNYSSISIAYMHACSYPYIHAGLLVHPCIHLCIQLLMYSCIHPFIHIYLSSLLLIYPPNSFPGFYLSCLLIYSTTIHQPILLSIHPLTHVSTNPHIHPYPSTHPFTHLLTHASMYPFTQTSS